MGIRNKIAYIIKHKLFLHPEMSCIFDDTSASFTPGHQDNLFSFCGLFYKNEVYYYIDNKVVSVENINRCLVASNALWHSLCVLSQVSIHNKTELAIFF